MPDDLEDLAGGRHFGVGGMRERALLVGGDLSVESAPGEGCVIPAWVPTEIVPRESNEGEERAPRLGGETDLREDEGGERPARVAGETDLPGRSVPGYTWQ